MHIKGTSRKHQLSLAIALVLASGMVQAGEIPCLTIIPGTDCIADGTVNSADLGTNSVGSAEIQTDAVGSAEIQTDAVGSAEIAAGAVDSAEIATGAVTSDKIGSSAVTTDKINNLAVTTDKINDSAVTADKIADGAVRSSEILDNSITIDDIGTGAVGSDEILNNSITIDDIGTGAVGSDEILNNSITIDDIGTGAVGSDEILDDSITADDIGTLTELRVMDGNTDMIVDINGFDLDVGVGDSIAMRATDTGVTNDHSDLILTGTSATLSFTDITPAQTNSVTVDADSVDIVGGTGTTNVNIGDDLVITTDSMKVTAAAGGDVELIVSGAGTASMTDGTATVSTTGGVANMNSGDGNATVTDDLVSLKVDDAVGDTSGAVEVEDDNVNLKVDNSSTGDEGYVNITDTMVEVKVFDSSDGVPGGHGLTVGLDETTLTGGDSSSGTLLNNTEGTLWSDTGTVNLKSLVGGGSINIDSTASGTTDINLMSGTGDTNITGDELDVDTTTVDINGSSSATLRSTSGGGSSVVTTGGSATMTGSLGNTVTATSVGTVTAASSTAGTGELMLTNTMSSMSGGFGVDRTTLTLDNDGAHLDNHLDMGHNQINNLADGYSDYDAVNKRQLDEVDDRAKEGIAAVAAMASIPGPIPGKRYSVGVGLGSFESETALAVGLNAQVTDQIMVKASAGISDSETTGGVGASFSW
jgi:hypothetical protein